jgi:hypothetical protein
VVVVVRERERDIYIYIYIYRCPILVLPYLAIIILDVTLYSVPTLLPVYIYICIHAFFPSLRGWRCLSNLQVTQGAQDRTALSPAHAFQTPMPGIYFIVRQACRPRCMCLVVPYRTVWQVRLCLCVRGWVLSVCVCVWVGGWGCGYMHVDVMPCMYVGMYVCMYIRLYSCQLQEIDYTGERHIQLVLPTAAEEDGGGGGGVSQTPTGRSLPACLLACLRHPIVTIGHCSHDTTRCDLVRHRRQCLACFAPGCAERSHLHFLHVLVITIQMTRSSSIPPSAFSLQSPASDFLALLISASDDGRNAGMEDGSICLVQKISSHPAPFLRRGGIPRIDGRIVRPDA